MLLKKIFKIKKLFMFWIYYPYFAKFLPLDTIKAKNKNADYIIPRIYVAARSTRVFLCGEVYEEETLKYIRENYDNKGSIIHAGCSWGDHMPPLSKILSKNFYLYAFEPNNLSFKYAMKNKLINNLDNVRLFNCALGETLSESFINLTDKKGNILAGTSIISDEGTIEERWKSIWHTFLFKILKIKPDNYNNSIISKKNIVRQKIKINRLDDLISKNEKISIIFLDVELFEEKVLKGAIELIKNNYPILVLEYFDQEKFNSSIIKKLGYKFITKCNNNFVYKYVN